MQVESSVTIQRPVEDVFAFITDPEATSQWQAATIETKKLTDGAVGIGTCMSHLGKFLGQEIETIAEVIEYEPNSQYRYKSIEGYLPVDMRYILEPVQGGTKLSTSLQEDRRADFLDWQNRLWRRLRAG